MDTKQIQQRVLALVPAQVLSDVFATRAALAEAPVSAAGLIAINHLVNAVGGILFFKVPHDIPKFKLLAFLATYTACAMVSIREAAAATSSSTLRRRAGLALAVASTSLYWWTVKATRRQPLTAIHSQDSPQHVNTTGPYGLARHPFYSAYVTNFLAGAVTAGNPASVLAFIGAFLAYYRGAKEEEAKFAQSDLARKYTNYKRRTAMLIPFLF
ncbi:hypothetical protein OIO90_000117 [Microbotryomycetes sp. JL221]|nr:hypothetical protein OIO90_000117 [Microbotryomycetes sp. JL221]